MKTRHFAPLAGVLGCALVAITERPVLADALTVVPPSENAFEPESTKGTLTLDFRITNPAANRSTITIDTVSVTMAGETGLDTKWDAVKDLMVSKSCDKLALKPGESCAAPVSYSIDDKDPEDMQTKKPGNGDFGGWVVIVSATAVSPGEGSYANTEVFVLDDCPEKGHGKAAVGTCTVTPEPNTLWLFASCLLGVAGTLRRRADR